MTFDRGLKDPKRIEFQRDQGPEMPWGCPDCQASNTHTPKVELSGWAISWSKDAGYKGTREQRNVFWVSYPKTLSCTGCGVKWMYVGPDDSPGEIRATYYIRAMSRLDLLLFEEG
jgi:hypothetical protein